MKDMNWPERVAYLENQLADSDRDNKRLSEFIKGLPDGDETPAQLAEAQRFRRSTMYWHERAMKAEARLAEAERKIAGALRTAGGRWCEWGSRAESVRDILQGTTDSASGSRDEG